MVTERRQSGNWMGRLVNELYLGALVLGAVVVVGGVLAAVVAALMEISHWVALAD